MATYVIRRILVMIPSLLGIALITFILMHSTKGGPFTSEHSNPETTKALQQAYHLDEPLWPTFYGEGAGSWQIFVALLGAAGVGIGVALLQMRRRPAAALSGAPRASAAGRTPFLTLDQIARLLIAAGVLLLFWWLIMMLQGQPTQLAGNGFTAGQFFRFLGNLVRGDLGPSFSQKGRGVTEIIVPAAVNSFVLGFGAFCLLVLMAIPLGVIAALRQNSWVDYVATTFSLIGYSIPNFVLGLVLILAVGLKLGWLPISGWNGPQYLIMPAFVLAIRPMAVLTRLTRASMLEVLHQDYIRTAWSKGLSGRVVVIRHALRNALLPIVTVMGDQLGDLVTGSLIVESLFAIPGVGHWFVDSINKRDYGMIMGTTIFYATLVLVINLVVDLLYGVIDPRVRLGAGARS